MNDNGKSKQIHKCLSCEELFICEDNLCNDNRNPSDSICDLCLERSLRRFASPDNRRFALPLSWLNR